MVSHKSVTCEVLLFPPVVLPAFIITHNHEVNGKMPTEIMMICEVEDHI